MASHKQIDKNVADVTNAWGRFQTLVHVGMLRSRINIDNARRQSHQRRRYTT